MITVSTAEDEQARIAMSRIVLDAISEENDRDSLCKILKSCKDKNVHPAVIDFGRAKLELMRHPELLADHHSVRTRRAFRAFLSTAMLVSIVAGLAYLATLIF